MDDHAARALRAARVLRDEIDGLGSVYPGFRCSYRGFLRSSRRRRRRNRRPLRVHGHRRRRRTKRRDCPTRRSSRARRVLVSAETIRSAGAGDGRWIGVRRALTSWPASFRPRRTNRLRSSFFARPVRLAKLPLQQLAGVGSRQVLAELDRPRDLVAGEVLAAILTELGDRLRPDARPRVQLDEAFTSSPQSSFGTPITPTSATFGCWRSTFSISAG